MSKSLLPKNASPLELALSRTRSEATNLKTSINHLIDPYKCPVPFLPFLAWRLSVDYWDIDWPEQTKREMIAKAYLLHAIKGSVPAIRKALSIFGYTANFEMWHQSNPPKTAGTFSMVVNLNNHGIDEVREREVARLITENKAISRHVSELSFAMASTGKIHIAAALFVGEETIIYPNTLREITSTGGLNIKAALQIIETTTLKTEVSNGQ